MEISRILLAAFVGTSVMTAFSYIVSELSNKLFKEPVLLDYVMKLLNLEWSNTARRVAGWMLHFSIGTIFVIALELVLNYFDAELNLATALIYGSLAGIIGILGWMIIFRLPPRMPDVDYKRFYLQLFFAHILFGLSVFMVYTFFTA